MTVSSYKKMFKQLKAKPVKLKRYLKHNKPREKGYGSQTRRCRRCQNTKGFISKYGINLCRRCFREAATKIGFKKYS
jgi:ribosomal protein S14